MVADGAGHAYLVGSTTAADFPTAITTSGAMNGAQILCASCAQSPPLSDAFLLEIQESAVSLPSVAFNLPHIAFSPQPVGTQNAPSLVAIHNTGESPLTITSLLLTGPNSGDFSLIGQSACSGQTIPAGGQCALAVVSPLSINFGSVPVGAPVSTGQTITITNPGNQALTIASVAESGSDAAQFPVNGSTFTCGPTLPAGQSCSTQAFFAPVSQGTFHAQIVITDNSAGIANAQQVVSLTGTGVAPAPILSISVPALAFGTVVIGTTNGAQSVTLAN